MPFQTRTSTSTWLRSTDRAIDRPLLHETSLPVAHSSIHRTRTLPRRPVGSPHLTHAAALEPPDDALPPLLKSSSTLACRHIHRSTFRRIDSQTLDSPGTFVLADACRFPMDAACGPSNGVKSLQRHLDRDGSLHQSRIQQTDGVHGQQQFRGAPMREQVERANREHGEFLQQGSRRNLFAPVLSQQQQQQQFQGLQTNAWAQDFRQSLPASQQPALHGHHPGASTTSGSSTMGAWGNEFLAMTQQQQQQQPPQQSQRLQMADPGIASNNHFANPSFQGSGFLGQPSLAPTLFSAQLPTTTMRTIGSDDVRLGSMDQAAFSDAFAEAEASLAAAATITAATATETGLERDLSLGGTYDSLQSSLAQELLASEQSQAPRFSPPQNDDTLSTESTLDTTTGRRRDDDDALASTAGELIHALRDERADKFRKSNFMALMHRLRDGEVVVTENRMVEAASGDEIAGNRTRDVDGDGHGDGHAFVSPAGNQLQDVTF